MWGVPKNLGAHSELLRNSREIEHDASSAHLPADQGNDVEKHAIEFLKKVVRVPGVRISRDDFLRARSTPAGQAALAELRVDELRFVDMAQSVMWFGTEERVI